jgi:hypothetical protein
VPFEKDKGGGDSPKQSVSPSLVGDFALYKAYTDAVIWSDTATERLGQELMPQAEPQVGHVFFYYTMDGFLFCFEKGILSFLIHVHAAT